MPKIQPVSLHGLDFRGLVVLAEQLAHYHSQLAQAQRRLTAGMPEAEAQALDLLKSYRQWLKTLPETAEAETALEAAVEALKDALSRQCRL